MSIRWLAPTATNGIIRNYTVKYTQGDSRGCVDYNFGSETIVTSTVNNATQIVLVNIQKATSYEFVISALNDFGESQPTSDSCTTYTREDGKRCTHC